MPTRGGGHAPAGHEGHGHDSILYNLVANPPNAGQFIEGSLGASAGKNFKLEAGAGFKGKKGRKPNGNDQKQNNLTKADANRSAYGIPKTVAGTNAKPNYVMDIQVGIAMGGLEALRPDVLQKLIDQQNAGKGSVWNGVAYLAGLNDAHDGSVTPELEAMRGEIMNMQVGKSGRTLAQWAENPKDSRGNNWARTNHAQTGIKAYLQLEAAGVPSEVANKVANNDDLVSGAGRIDQIAPGRASNNQENTFTGMNNAERKQWEKAAQYSRELGKPEILRIMMDSHTMGSHMLTQYGNKGAKSKINGNLGLDPNLPADQRKAVLVDYFLNNPKDPKKGDKAKGGGAKDGAANVGANGGAAAKAGGDGGKAAAAAGAGAVAGSDSGTTAGGGPMPPGATGAPVANAAAGADLLGQLQQLLAQLTAILAALTGAQAAQPPAAPTAARAATGGVGGASSGQAAQGGGPTAGGRLPQPTAAAGGCG